MKILLDTSIIVEIDRKNKLSIGIIKKLVAKYAVYISVVTLSEILTGGYLRDDYEDSVAEINRVLSQFYLIDMDSDIADTTAKFQAKLIKAGKIIEYPDIVIAATFNKIEGDYLLTLNKAHFDVIAELKGKVFTPEDFITILK